jgi:hypothetical protein
MRKEQYRIIPFIPHMVSMLGDINSCIYYIQLWYWQGKGRRSDGYIYKTKTEIEFETTLSREQQDRVREKLVKKGWLDVKLWRANAHATYHYLCLRNPITGDRLDLSKSRQKSPTRSEIDAMFGE